MLTPTIAKVLATLTAVVGIVSAHAVEPTAPASDGTSVSGRVKMAIVIPHLLTMRLANHPATIDITSEDIALGEIVVRGSSAQIIANDRGGYRLRAELAVSPFAEVEIIGFDANVRAHSGFTDIEAAPDSPRPYSQSRALEYRLKISSDVQPGRYRWPIAVSVLTP